VVVRPAQAADRQAVAELFDASQRAGQDARDGDGLDAAKAATLELLACAETARSSAGPAGASAAANADAWVWVAQLEDGPIVGTAALRRLGEHEVELVRVQIHPEHRRRGYATKLLERVLGFCHEQGMLKIALDTDAADAPAISLFQKFHFHLHRAREEQPGRQRLEYYLDLYQKPRQEG